MAFGFAEMEMGVMVLFQRWFGFAGGDGKGLRWFCDGGWCKWDGVCLQKERIFGGVWLGNGVYESNLGKKRV
ncbi:unnamed protein product [Prunus armeniaca]